MAFYPAFGNFQTKLHNVIQSSVWFFLLFYGFFFLAFDPQSFLYNVRVQHPIFIFVYQIIQFDQVFEVSATQCYHHLDLSSLYLMIDLTMISRYSILPQAGKRQVLWH